MSIPMIILLVWLAVGAVFASMVVREIERNASTGNTPQTARLFLKKVGFCLYAYIIGVLLGSLMLLIYAIIIIKDRV